MTYYETLVLIHVLAAVTWVGGNAVMQILATRARRSRDPGRIAAVAGDVEWVGTRVFVPASLVLIAAGVLGAIEADLDWGAAWVSIGLAVWVASFVTGAAFLGPESGRIRRLTAELGVGSAVVQARIARVLMIARIELVLLVVVVWAMVTKPGV